MKPLIRLTKRVLRVWWMAALAVIVLCLVGCRTYVPVETVRTEVVKELEIQRDSIYVLDSVFVRSKADTVFVERWRVEYKEALRVDTLHIVERDSTNNVVEIDRPLTKWQQVKMDVGLGTMIALPLLVALYILYRRLKK